VGARLKAKLLAAGAEGYRSASQADHELIGDLIRAIDAVARRADELAGRITDLEVVVQEVVAVMSEDLVRILAFLEPAPDVLDDAAESDPAPPAPAPGG
jgi:hypothetical protein